MSANNDRNRKLRETWTNVVRSTVVVYAKMCHKQHESILPCIISSAGGDGPAVLWGTLSWVLWHQLCIFSTPQPQLVSWTQQRVHCIVIVNSPAEHLWDVVHWEIHKSAAATVILSSQHRPKSLRIVCSSSLNLHEESWRFQAVKSLWSNLKHLQFKKINHSQV